MPQHPDGEVTPAAMKAAAKALAAMGGTARAKQLSKRRQSEIAKIAARARWGKAKRKAAKRP